MPIIIPWETTKATETKSIISKLITEKRNKKLIQKQEEKKQKNQNKVKVDI